MKKPHFKPLSETGRNVVKGATQFVVARTVSGVVVTLVRQNVSVETKSQKIGIAVGAYLIGSKVASVVNEDVQKTVDTLLNAYNGSFEKKTETEEPVIIEGEIVETL